MMTMMNMNMNTIYDGDIGNDNDTDIGNGSKDIFN